MIKIAAIIPIAEMLSIFANVTLAAAAGMTRLWKES